LVQIVCGARPSRRMSIQRFILLKLSQIAHRPIYLIAACHGFVKHTSDDLINQVEEKRKELPERVLTDLNELLHLTGSNGELS